MDIRAVIEQNENNLTPSERDLVKQILLNLKETAMMTAAELANRVGVHESTAVRLVQKLGFSGFRDFRRALQNEVLDTVDSADRVARRLARSHNLEDLVSDEIKALEQMTSVISQEQLNRAATDLVQANHIFLFARGHATLLVEFMDRRLRRSGFRTVDLRAEARDLAERAVALGEGDVLLCFILRQIQPGYAALMHHARNVGARSIVISDTVGPILRPRPDVLLWASRGTKGEILTHVVPLTICNALILTIYELDHERRVEALDRVTTLIHTFSNADDH